MTFINLIFPLSPGEFIATGSLGGNVSIWSLRKVRIFCFVLVFVPFDCVNGCTHL